MTDEPISERTPCPAWCAGEQCLEADPVDRFHQGETVLSVIYRHVERQQDGSLIVRPEAAELTIAKFTSAVTGVLDETWVSLDMGPRGYITLTEESMRRVKRDMRQMLKPETYL